MVDIRKGSSSLLIRIIGMGLGYFITIIISQSKGPEALGLFTWIWSFSQIFSALFKIGLDYLMIPKIAWLYHEGRQYKADSYYLNVLMHILVICASVSAIFVLIEDVFLESFEILGRNNYVFYSVLLSAVSLAIFQSVFEYLKAQGKVLLASFFQNLAIFLVLFVSILCLNILGLIKGVNIAYVLMVSFVLSVFISLFVAYTLSGRKITSFRLPKIQLKNYLEGAPYMFQAFWVLALTWIDVILMGLWAPAEEVGIYSAVSRLGALSTLVLFTLNGLIMKDLAVALKARDSNSLKHIITRITYFNQVLSFLIIIFIWIFARFALGFFGEEFLSADFALKLLLIGYAVNLLFGPTDIILQLSGKPYRVVLSAMIGVIVNIIFASYLIPLYGVLGASISTGISLITFRLITIYYCWFELGIISINYNTSYLKGRHIDG